LRAGFLIDALGNCHHVRLLFAGVRGEFLLDRFRRNSYRCNRMLCVSQHADDFRRQHSLQDLYRFGSPAKTVGGPGLLAALRIASKPPVNYR
jgi:hypothetical protein